MSEEVREGALDDRCSAWARSVPGFGVFYDALVKEIKWLEEIPPNDRSARHADDVKSLFRLANHVMSVAKHLEYPWAK